MVHSSDWMGVSGRGGVPGPFGFHPYEHVERTPFSQLYEEKGKSKGDWTTGTGKRTGSPRNRVDWRRKDTRHRSLEYTTS